MSGKVYLVGAGPGDPELLTLKALRLLESAEVVLHDDLVPPAILAYAPSSAQVINVGKRCGRKGFRQEEIDELAISYARDSFTVVRLQGGDPLIFGRAGEEMAALREAGVDFEIVPGVTSALGAAAAAQVSLTERRVASSVLFMTGQHCHEQASADGAKADDLAATLRPTVVVYMPTDYAAISKELRAAGWDSDTPCLVVSKAGTTEESSSLTTLEELPNSPQLPSPKLLIIGAVAKDADLTEICKAEEQSESTFSLPFNSRADF